MPQQEHKAVEDDTDKVYVAWSQLFSLYTLHFLPPLSTLLVNQYLSVPAGLANSVWNSVCSRCTQSLEDVTRQALAKPSALSFSITAHSSKQGLGIFTKAGWSWGYIYVYGGLGFTDLTKVRHPECLDASGVFYRLIQCCNCSGVKCTFEVKIND